MLKRLSVAKRLYVGFGLMLAILVVVTAVGVYKVQAIDAALTANSREHVLIQRYAINFRGSAHDRAIAARDVVLSVSPQEVQAELALIKNLAQFYADSAAPLEALVASSTEANELRALYADIQAIEAKAVLSTEAVIRKVADGDAEGARSLLWGQVKPEYVQWLAAINKLIDFEEARIQAKTKVAQEEAGSFLRVMLIALLIALVCGVTLAAAISRSLIRQLGAEPADLGEVAKRVARGDLQSVQGVRVEGGDSVIASLGAMQVSLQSIVSQVRVASDAIAAKSTEISNDNADLNLRTQTQAEQLQKTVATMEQMTVAVRANADSAQEATLLASSASQAAQRGGEVMQQVIGTMDDISTSSRKIGDIIGVIDSIAFQTNILALNAAVEAARAGEQGRGFAVVASEVRSLAQRSAEAAREIKALIENSVGKVESGAQLVTTAGGAIDDIVRQVQQVASIIQDISESTKEQTGDIGKVSEALATLDHATQDNLALAERAFLAADALHHNANRLTDAVRVFNVGQDFPQQLPRLALTS